MSHRYPQSNARLCDSYRLWLDRNPRRGLSQDQSGARVAERDPARGVIQLTRGEAAPGKEERAETGRAARVADGASGRRAAHGRDWRVGNGRPTVHIAKRQLVHARLQRVGQVSSTVVLAWGAHERISVKRIASPPGVARFYTIVLTSSKDATSLPRLGGPVPGATFCLSQAPRHTPSLLRS